MLITLEGLAGSGKTMALEALRETHRDAVFTGEPATTWYAEVIEQYTADDRNQLTPLFLSIADHADHLSRVVRPALERGEVVISDQYSDSRYAHQAAAIEGEIPRPMEYVRGVHQPFTRPPDATIYLDVDPETGAARSGATNEFEQAAFLAQVAANYERLLELEPGRFVRVDATRSPEEVIDSVETVVRRLIDEG